jgi:protein-tyrosine phosphatase
MPTPVSRILFVCMGNICRSPAAEMVFDHMTRSAGRAKEFLIDSAGTIGMHQGNPPDHRMRQHLTKRGYPIFGTARKIEAEDLKVFDWILVMDEENERDVRRMDREGQYKHKIRKLTDFGIRFQADRVPDPYYGGDEGFAHVIDLIEDACTGLLETLAKPSPAP